jgi:hypothetical protein
MVFTLSPRQFEGYQLYHNGGHYGIEARYHWGMDQMVYRTYDAKEVLVVFDNLVKTNPVKKQ